MSSLHTDIEKKLPHQPENGRPRVVIIGGGFAGVELARRIDTSSMEVVLIDKKNYHTFQPLLYEVAASGLDTDAVAGPLRDIVSQRRIHFRMTEATRVVPQRQIVETTDGELYYDTLVIASGSDTNFFGQEDNMEDTNAMKSVPDAVALRNKIIKNIEIATLAHDKDDIDRLLNITITGAGPSGVELAGALADAKKRVFPSMYPDLDFKYMNITLVEGMDQVLNGMSDKASRLAEKYLRKHCGVHLILGKLVSEKTNGHVRLSDDSHIKTDILIWTAGVKGCILPGIDENIIKKSQYKVDEFNKLEGYENIYAIGDVAAQSDTNYPDGYPNLAPVAIQQGIRLAKNLSRLHKGLSLKPFKFRNKGTMAVIGRNKAVVDLSGGLTFGGFTGWFLWKFVHILSIYSLKRKAVVLVHWFYNYFKKDRNSSQVIELEGRDKK